MAMILQGGAPPSYKRVIIPWILWIYHHISPMNTMDMLDLLAPRNFTRFRTGAPPCNKPWELGDPFLRRQGFCINHGGFFDRFLMGDRMRYLTMKCGIDPSKMRLGLHKNTCVLKKLTVWTPPLNFANKDTPSVVMLAISQHIFMLSGCQVLDRLLEWSLVTSCNFQKDSITEFATILLGFSP